MGETGIDQIRQADKFMMTLDGIQVASFREVKGLEVKVPVEEFYEGGLNDHHHKLPGQARWSTIVLRRGSSVNLELFDWIERAIRGELIFRSGTIMALNRKAEPILVWEFRKAWPCGYQGSSLDRTRSEMHIETLELGHHGFTLRQGGNAGSMRGPLPASPAQAPSTPPSALDVAHESGQAYRTGYEERLDWNFERAQEREPELTMEQFLDEGRSPEHYRSKTSAVVDKKTGKTYSAQNGSPYPDLHPALASQLPADSQEDWPVHNCAEVKAINMMLWDREAQGMSPATLDDVEMATIHSSSANPDKSGSKKKKAKAKMCKNCQRTFGGTPVEVTTG